MGRQGESSAPRCLQGGDHRSGVRLLRCPQRRTNAKAGCSRGAGSLTALDAKNHGLSPRWLLWQEVRSENPRGARGQAPRSLVFSGALESTTPVAVPFPPVTLAEAREGR